MTGKANLIRAHGVAFKLAREYGFSHPSQIDLEAIAMDRGVLVVYGGLQGCEARLVRKGKNAGLIRIRDDIPECGRQRFALAHDLGHWELHDQSQWFVCSSADLRDYEQSPAEIEANSFASELLMPTFMVRPRCEKAAPDLTLMKAIAEEFNVSLTSAAIRVLRESKHECVLVYSYERRVKWWKKKSDRYGIWIQSRQPIDQQSVAWFAFNREDWCEQGDTVPASAWFQGVDLEIEVFEQSIFLGSYNAVLSLLVLAD